jgi:hypothetical protein
MGVPSPTVRRTHPRCRPSRRRRRARRAGKQSASSVHARSVVPAVRRVPPAGGRASASSAATTCCPCCGECWAVSDRTCQARRLVVDQLTSYGDVGRRVSVRGHDGLLGEPCECGVVVTLDREDLVDREVLRPWLVGRSVVQVRSANSGPRRYVRPASRLAGPAVDAWSTAACAASSSTCGAFSGPRLGDAARRSPP